MKDGFDYTQFEEYVKKFENIEKEFEDWLKTFLLEQAERCMGRTRARQKALGLVDTGYMSEAWAVGKLSVVGNTLQVEVGNPAEYASYVEWGHSQEVGRFVPAIGKRLVNNWVEGGFMFTISLDEVERAMPTRFQTEFIKFLKEWGIN